MTQSMEELIERLREAKGPDRELAADICEVLGFKVRRNSTTRHGRRAAAWAYLAEDRRWHAVEPILASIDAALALVERVLPGTWWLMAKGRVQATEPMHHGVQLFAEGHNPYTSLPLAESEHDDLPLAIILALLTALNSKASP